jgi:hypothetical protein
MTNHPPLGLVDVFAATQPTLNFAPGLHVNYAETVLPMRDGLPKLKDFPKEFGGSGEQIAEAPDLGCQPVSVPCQGWRVGWRTGRLSRRIGVA